MNVKDFVNGQSANLNTLEQVHAHLKAAAEHMARVHELVGLESGTPASGSSGAGSQDGIKYLRDPELALASLRQELKQARERAVRCGLRVKQ
jgi:hypothetical protein